MSSSHALKENHPHGSNGLNAQRNGIDYKAHALNILQLPHSTDKPSDLRAGVEDSNMSVGGLMRD